MMGKGKSLVDCPILVAEHLNVREAIIFAIQKDIEMIIIKSDSQSVINLLIARFVYLKKLWILQRYQNLTSFFRDINFENGNMFNQQGANSLVKKIHLIGYTPFYPYVCYSLIILLSLFEKEKKKKRHV